MTTETMKTATNTLTEPHRIADTLAQQGGRLGEKLDTMAATTRDVYAKGKERAESWGGSLGTYVKEQPIKALLIAAGAGLVIGALGMRSRN